MPAIDCFAGSCAEPVLAQLERDSSLGVSRADRLARAERLARRSGCMRAHLAMPVHARVYTVVEAIPGVGGLLGGFSGIGSGPSTSRFLESFPSTRPLVPLSPALRRVHEVHRGRHGLGRGRFPAAVRPTSSCSRGSPSPTARACKTSISHPLGCISCSDYSPRQRLRRRRSDADVLDRTPGFA